MVEEPLWILRQISIFFNEPLLPHFKIQLYSLGLFVTCNVKVMLKKSQLGVMATDGI